MFGFGFTPKLPVAMEERAWVDASFSRLERLLGAERMLDAEVVLPVHASFPYRYDRTPATLNPLFTRLCRYMGVAREAIDLQVFPDEEELLRESLPFYRSRGTSCAGFYTRDPEHDRMIVAVKSSQLKDPLALVATLAHELGHAILLGGELVGRQEVDMEPLTDLATVYLGLGVFTSSAAGRFRQFRDGGRQGWSMSRTGYLSQPLFGYALARFALRREESKPAWEKHLSPNVRDAFKHSRGWLLEEAGG